MKFKSFYSAIVLAIIVIFLYSFSTSSISSKNSDKVNSWGLNTPFVSQLNNKLGRPRIHAIEEMKFFIRGVNGRPITKTVLLSANTVDELIPNFPSSWIEKYNSVWIKTKLGEEAFSLMSEDNLLNSDQKSLFKQTDIGTTFELIINYQHIDPITHKIDYDQMTEGFIVIPEIEAEYPYGYDALIAYFDTNLTNEYKGEKFEDFAYVGVKFFIAENGNADLIHQSIKSGYPEIDQFIMQLVKDMPAWKSASNISGNLCRQEFELIFGIPGC